MSATANIKVGRAYVEVTADSSKLRRTADIAANSIRIFGLVASKMTQVTTATPRSPRWSGRRGFSPR